MAIAAETAARRLDDEARERCGDDGVDRVAALGQHADARFGLVCMARRDDAALGEHLGLAVHEPASDHLPFRM